MKFGDLPFLLHCLANCSDKAGDFHVVYYPLFDRNCISVQMNLKMYNGYLRSLTSTNGDNLR